MTMEKHPSTFDSIEDLQTLLLTIKQAAGDAILNGSSHSKDAALWMIEKLSAVAVGDMDKMLRREGRQCLLED